jgi:hypothetical protein
MKTRDEILLVLVVVLVLDFFSSMRTAARMGYFTGK